MTSESKLIHHNCFQETVIGKIPFDWDVIKAQEYCQRVTDGTHSTPKKTSRGKYLVTSKHLTEGEIDFSKAYLISENDFYEINKRSKVDQWDVVIGMIGEYLGGVYLEKNRIVDYAIKNVGLFKCTENESKGKWLYYYLSSKIAKEYLKSIRSGTSQPYITLDSLRNFPIIFPKNKLEREKIICIADSIQNKINSLHDMNRILEAFGAALFRRWFVDFEFPNQEGKPYRSTDGKMIDSELGGIPSGWQVGCLGDICEIVMGQSPPGETYNEIGEGIPFFQGIRDFGFRFPTKRVYCTAPKRFAEEGDVLLSVRAPVGSLNIAEERCAIGRGVGALRLKGKQNSFLYYLLLATRSAWDKYDAKGTVFGSATKQDVYDFKIVSPKKELQEKFATFMEAIDKKILLNERESRNLTTIRDLLLPKLMSGKIRVPINKEDVEMAVT